jgi:hypothetical protein
MIGASAKNVVPECCSFYENLDFSVEVPPEASYEKQYGVLDSNISAAAATEHECLGSFTTGGQSCPAILEQINVT